MSASFLSGLAVAATNRDGDDRAIVLPIDGGIVIALADGAGGTGRGSAAAQAVVDAVTADPTVTDWADFLVELDDPRRLGFGQTTAVIATVTARGIVGASVGDSAAWLVRGGRTSRSSSSAANRPI